MLTEKDYCDYETCVALKELGFPLHPYGNTEIDTSLRLTLLLYEAQKWLREEKKIIVNIDIDYNWYYGIYFSEGNIYPPQFSEGEYGSYEEALSEGIKEAVKILKEK